MRTKPVAASPERGQDVDRGSGEPLPWSQSWADNLVESFAERNFSKWILGLPIGALFLLLGLRRWDLVAKSPIWVYVAAAVFSVLVTMVVKPWSEPLPLGPRLTSEVIAGTSGATCFIYVTGWGPELTVAYVVIAAVTLMRHGSAAWKITLSVNTIAVVLGQAAVAAGLAPSKLTVSEGQVLALLGIVAFWLMIGIMTITMKWTEREAEKVQTSEERFRSLLQHSSDTTIVIDPSGTRLLYASPATLELLEVSAEELQQRGPKDFIGAHELGELAETITLSLVSQRVIRTEFSVTTAKGRKRYVEGTISDLEDNRAINGIVVNVHDITARKQLEEVLSEQVRHDPLTGLPNRRYLKEILELAIVRGRRDARMPVVLFLDLDRFKEVNDGLGHLCGDSLLVQLGQRMQECMRKTDTLARFGGDEFVVVGEDVEGPHAILAMAERLIGCVSEPFEIDGHQVTVGMSIGIAEAHPSMSAEELLEQADQAMYVAKSEHVTHMALANVTPNPRPAPD